MRNLLLNDHVSRWGESGGGGGISPSLALIQVGSQAIHLLWTHHAKLKRNFR